MTAPVERPVLFGRAFILLSVANLAMSIAGAFQIHLSGFVKALGAGEAQVGLIIALNALTAAVLGPFAGRWMDRQGRRIVVRTGALLWLMATGGYLLIDRIGPQLYLLRVLDGAAATLLYSTMFTYASELVPLERRTQGIALFGASGLVTIGISSLLGDRILASASYRELFATALAFAAVGAVLCWVLPESPHGGSQPHHAQHGLRRTALQRDLVPVWAVALAFFACMASVLSFMKTFVLATGYGSVGGFFGAYTLVALILRVFLGSMPDRIGLRRMVLPAVGAYALGCVLIAHASGGASLLLAGAVCGAGHGYGFPVLLSLVVSRAHPASRGTATGIYTAIDWLGNVLAPPLLGLLIERSGYPFAYGALGSIGFAGIALFYALDRGAGAR